jgi:glycerol kinase
MNLDTLEWDEDLLATMEIPRALLPEIRSSSEVFGIAAGDLSGVPVAGVLGDQQAALFGHTCFHQGEMKNTYGTGAFLLFTLGEKPVMSKHGLVTTVAWKLGDAQVVYALEGSVAIAGALVQWLRDNLGIIDDAADVEGLARSVQDSGAITHRDRPGDASPSCASWPGESVRIVGIEEEGDGLGAGVDLP